MPNKANKGKAYQYRAEVDPTAGCTAGVPDAEKEQGEERALGARSPPRP